MEVQTRQQAVRGIAVRHITGIGAEPDIVEDGGRQRGGDGVVLHVADTQWHIGRAGARRRGAGVIAEAIFAMPVIGDASEQAVPYICLPAQAAVPTRSARHIGVAVHAIAGVVARQAAPDAVTQKLAVAGRHRVLVGAEGDGGGRIQVRGVIGDLQVAKGARPAGIEREAAAGDIIALGGFQPQFAVTAQLEAEARRAAGDVLGGARRDGAARLAHIAAQRVGPGDVAHQRHAVHDGQLGIQPGAQHAVAAVIPVGLVADADAGARLHGGTAIGIGPHGIGAAQRQLLRLKIPQRLVFAIGVEARGLGRRDVILRRRILRRRIHARLLGIGLLRIRLLRILFGILAAHRRRRAHVRRRALDRTARLDAQREAVGLRARQKGDGTRRADHAIVEIGIGHGNPLRLLAGQTVEHLAVHGGLEIQRQRVLGVVGMDAAQGNPPEADLDAVLVGGHHLIAGGALGMRKRRRGRGQRHGQQQCRQRCGKSPKHLVPSAASFVNRG